MVCCNKIKLKWCYREAKYNGLDRGGLLDFSSFFKQHYKPFADSYTAGQVYSMQGDCLMVSALDAKRYVL